MNTTEKIILEYLKEKGSISPQELAEYLKITERGVHKQLKKLLSQNEIEKVGTSPKTFYKIKEEKSSAKDDVDFSETATKIINQNFITITPSGQYLSGVEAFKHWCKIRNFDVTKKAHEYVAIIQKYESLKKNKFIDGMSKLKATFTKIYLDKIYYLDFYSIEIFGKTKLGQQLLYAKQSQNKLLIRELINEIAPRVKELIKNFTIDGVLFVPPTVKREVQFMRELETTLKLNVRSVDVTKIKTPIIIPQKTLSKLEERIENAKRTFVIEETHHFTNIMIIDDAVGSGATMNEIAKLARDRGIVSGKIIGLAITGSLKGFDVISEI